MPIGSLTTYEICTRHKLYIMMILTKIYYLLNEKMIKLFYRKIEEIKVYKHILNKIAIFYLILHLHLILQFYIV